MLIGTKHVLLAQHLNPEGPCHTDPLGQMQHSEERTYSPQAC
jgi:hypothetical protein